MRGFSVTYELWTEESVEAGEPEESGFLAADLDLRSALDLASATESSHCSRSCIEASDSDPASARWITFHNGANWITGETEDRALHIPVGTTPSSRERIVRLAKSGRW